MQFSNTITELFSCQVFLTLEVISHLFALFPSHYSHTFRLCGASKSSNDLLLEQPSANTFHDS